MGLFDALNISASALSAERQRSEVAATNLANVDTTHPTAGKVPCRRQEATVSRAAEQRLHERWARAARQCAADGGGGG